jgi:hypothetical protein
LPIADFDVEHVVRRALQPGEQLRWSGRPGQGLRLRRADRWVIPFTIGWSGFALYAILSDPHWAERWFSLIHGILLLAVGVFAAILRIPLDAWRRASAAYAITDRRILIIDGVFRRTTKSLPFVGLPDITLTERRFGEGDVVFDEGDMNHVAAGGVVSKGRSVPDAFEFLPSARHVYEIARDAHQRACRAPAPERFDLSGLDTLFRCGLRATASSRAQSGSIRRSDRSSRRRTAS